MLTAVSCGDVCAAAAASTVLVLSADVVPECEKSSATTYYWYRQALDISDSISEGGGLNWKMTLCLLAAWTLVCLAMMKGIQSSGKVRKMWGFLGAEERSKRGQEVREDATLIQ